MVVLLKHTYFIVYLSIKKSFYSLKTAPGTKVRLNGKVPVSGGFLLLTPNNISVIGGTVQELYDKWKLSVVCMKASCITNLN